MEQRLSKLLPKGFTAITKRLLADLTGAKAYLVGGAVRDLMLGRPTKDYDLVVAGVPIPKLEHWLAEHGQVNLVGKTFGVFKWQPAGWSGEAIDVALPRTEHVNIGSGQYRDFTIQSDPNLPIEQDLLRRDFTINALALDLKRGEIIDPAQGRADLSKGRIRTVGSPEQRLNEDLSRTLRAVRQACQLNFRLEPATLKGVIALSGRTATGSKQGEWLVPREVVARELLKALVANPVMALGLLDKTGFLNKLLPEVVAMKGVPQPSQFHSEGDVFEHTMLALEAFGSPEWREFFGETRPSLNVVVATVLHDIGKPLTLRTPELHGVNRIRTDGHDVAGAQLVPEICQRLRLSSYVDPERGQVSGESITWLVQRHLLLAHGNPDVFKPSTIYRYFWHDAIRGMELQQLIFTDMHATRPRDGHSLTPRLTELRQRIAEVGSKLKAGKLELVLTGSDIMAAFKLRPGPAIGR
ncbi:MAG: hypothetical protein U1C53_02330, partial [Candidatus Veblenbacteria bacterium]|nr:hypothetical protein [Candidatus Veblenbacteria bacterium]